MNLFTRFLNQLPIKRDKIVFYSLSDSYGGSCKYIAEELLKRKLPADIVWVTMNHRAKTPKGVRAVCGKYRARYHLATARLIVSDTRLSFYWRKGFDKKPGQLYLQTWHSSFDSKKIEADVHTPIERDLILSRKDSQCMDCLLSNSDWLTETYRYAFYYAGQIMELGSPRNDLLFAPAAAAKSVRQRYRVPTGAKVALYAPTYHLTIPTGPDFHRLRRALEQRFGGEWCIIARAHPKSKTRRKRWDGAIDATAYPDCTELLAAADVVISDYSSCIFDYLLTGRPGFLYAPDAARFEKWNGFYYPLDETPFPFAENNDALEENILHFDAEAYRAKVESFLHEKGNREDGRASCKVADMVQEWMEAPVGKYEGVALKSQDMDKALDYAKAYKPNYNAMPVQRNKIVFNSCLKGYNCNPKYIAEEIIRQKLPYDLVWVVKRDTLRHIRDFPPQLRLVLEGSREALQEYATCRVRVSNATGTGLDPTAKGIKKKDGQYYIQTYHGFLYLKKVVMGVHKAVSQNSIDRIRKDAETMDYLLSNSAWETRGFRRLYWNYGTTLEYGHARNDIFFAPDQDEIRRHVMQKIGLTPEKKLLLYAPTWRDDGSMDWMTMDNKAVIDALTRRFGGEWEFGSKVHQVMVLRKNCVPEHGVKVHNLSTYPDMQELLVAADAVITDYSSSVFDYIHTRKPVFLYAPDREEFTRKRGSYGALEETPFPVAEDNHTLISNINNFDDVAYKKGIDQFLQKIGCIEDGHAAERAVQLIKKLVEED